MKLCNPKTFDTMRIFIISFLVMIIAVSCSEREEYLTQRHFALNYENSKKDIFDQHKMMKINRRLYKMNPDNQIYFTNMIQTNCSFGLYEKNIELLNQNSEMHEAYKNFYIALNMYREDSESNYKDFLQNAIDGNLPENPVIAFISAKCIGDTDMANKIKPYIYDYIIDVPERNEILYTLDYGSCQDMLRLFGGHCPECIACEVRGL